VPTDDYDILARVALLDAADDSVRLTTPVRCLDSESKMGDVVFVDYGPLRRNSVTRFGTGPQTPGSQR
jgi:hypothetical protein